MHEFEPKIVGFLYNWCSYAGAGLAGTSRTKYPIKYDGDKADLLIGGYRICFKP